MKILFVGVFVPNSTNVAQTRAFGRLGHEVIRYDYRKRARELGSYNDMDMELIQKGVGECPQLTIFSKCNGMSVKVINQFDRHVNLTCLWYMDPMHNFDNELVRKIHAATFSCFALYDPYKRGKEINMNSFFVHEGFDDMIFYPLDEDNHHIYVTSFIGSLYGDRKKYYDEVGFKVFSKSFRKEHNEVVHDTQINLNFTSGGCSDRVYKVLAAGGFLLTEPWPNMEKDFVVGRDLDIFTDVKSLKSKLSYYIARPEECKKIAKCGRKTVQKFTVLNWAKKILEIYEKIKCQ
jgi:spore maturation protein CgeB